MRACSLRHPPLQRGGGVEGGGVFPKAANTAVLKSHCGCLPPDILNQMHGNHADHGGQFFDDIGSRFDHLERRSNIINADVLDAWYDPSPRVIKAISDHLPWLIKTSPPTHGDGLRRTIAETRNIPSEAILTAGGSSQLIFALLPHLVPPASEALTLEPCYGEYTHFLETVLQPKLQRFILSPSLKFNPNWDEVNERARDAAFVGIVNPNSPTGNIWDKHEILRLRETMTKNSILWVDETYTDFAGEEHTLEAEASQTPNLIVCKSMSKFYALSGLRIGYVVAHPDLISRLEKFLPPWSVGLVAQVAGVNALLDLDYYRAKAVETAHLRTELETAISQLKGVTLFPSTANFLMVELGAPHTAAAVTTAMRNFGVHVRNCASMGESLGDRFIRVAVKNRSDNHRIVEVLRECLSE